MAEYTQYAKAPITEATIMFRLANEATPDGLTAAESFCKSQIQQYPDVRPITTISGKMAVVEPSITANIKKSQAYMGLSTDGTKMFQSHANMLAVSVFAPYPGWHSFEGEAIRIWNAYAAYMGATAASGIGLRYINRIYLESPLGDLSEYFLTRPELAPGMAQPVSNFFMQLQVPQTDIPCALTMNQTIMPSDSSTTCILLDLDLAADGNWEAADPAVIAMLRRLHGRENEIFEAIITDRVRKESV